VGSFLLRTRRSSASSRGQACALRRDRAEARSAEADRFESCPSTGASSAFVCADFRLGGYQNPIPLDETTDAVFAVGRMMPAALRCTAKGGLAATPTAVTLHRRLEKEQQQGSHEPESPMRTGGKGGGLPPSR
jgi:hypothetical protein